MTWMCFATEEDLKHLQSSSDTQLPDSSSFVLSLIQTQVHPEQVHQDFVRCRFKGWNTSRCALLLVDFSGPKMCSRCSWCEIYWFQTMGSAVIWYSGLFDASHISFLLFSLLCVILLSTKLIWKTFFDKFIGNYSKILFLFAGSELCWTERNRKQHGNHTGRRYFTFLELLLLAWETNSHRWPSEMIHSILLNWGWQKSS